MVQQIKRIYIEEARDWIKKTDSKSRVTKSMLAMLTGLDTRTITAIENQPPVEHIDGELCAEAAVLYRWVSNEEYTEDDLPRLLPILGRSHSFQSLVSASVGRNVTYQTVLDRLIESGNVEVVDDEYVSLINPYYQPVKPSEQVFVDSGSRSISRLSNTIIHNMECADPDDRILQQDRWSRFIPVEKVPELSTELRALIETQIFEVEELITRYEVTDGESETCKFGVGWFLFS